LFKNILVALDLDHGEFNARILDIAAKLAAMGEARLRLIHVRFAIERALEYLPDGFLKDEEASARARLLEMAKGTKLSADRLSAVSPIGSIYDEVLAAAAAFEADLIVMGAHRPSMAKYLLGGNAARIVRHASMSVMVVR
jgi:nucleotide-binding universal stress UspA family protein